MSSPPKQKNQPESRVSQPLVSRRRRSPRAGIIPFLVLIGLLILLSTSLLLLSVIQGTTHPTTSAVRRTPIHHVAPTATPSSQNATSTATPPLFAANNALIPPLQLPSGHYVIYEQQNNVYVISGSGGMPQLVHTPSYAYNQAVRPILTPTGQLLYSGNGLWLTDIFGGTAQQIAQLAPKQVITSMALSSDGTTLAWSTEPANGSGFIDLYVGPLAAPTKVYEQATTNCPCFRVFAFMNGAGKQGNTTLLLTDGQQSHEAIQFGLWTLDLTRLLSATPQPLLDEDQQQGPLALATSGNVLLYSTNEGYVPVPTDKSVPNDIAVLPYANSLTMTTLGGKPVRGSISQVILPEQHALTNSAVYHWVTTPVFSSDGHTLIYVVFSGDSQDPFDRHSALYKVQISGSGPQLHVSKPQLMATSTSLLFELGTWFNTSTLTFYADGTIYALNTSSGAVTSIVQTGVYARILAVVGISQP